MNYYYEIDPKYEGTVFGEDWKYWCMPNCSPAEGGRMNFKVHDDMMANSHRVWLENANGFYIVKPSWAIYRERPDEREFTMVKLKAKNLHRHYDRD